MDSKPLFYVLLSSLPVFLGLGLSFKFLIPERFKIWAIAFSGGLLAYLLAKAGRVLTGDLLELFQAATAGYPTWGDFSLRLMIFLVGCALGIAGSLFFEVFSFNPGKDMIEPAQQGKKTSLMAAAGCGFFHLAQGLALGSVYAWGEVSLALLLALGFALYSVLEGISIAHPISGYYPGTAHILTLGAIVVLPGVLGAMLGSYLTPKVFELLFIALYCGVSFVFIASIARLGRRIKPREDAWVGIGFAAGFVIAFAFETLAVFQTGAF